MSTAPGLLGLSAQDGFNERTETDVTTSARNSFVLMADLPIIQIEAMRLYPYFVIQTQILEDLQLWLGNCYTSWN